MKILHVGIFKDHCLGGDYVYQSALVRHFSEYRSFDYPTIAQEEGIDEMNRRFVEEAKGVDLVFIGRGDLIRRHSLAQIRRNGAIVSIWYGDMRPQPEEWLVENMAECDVLFMSSAGETLKRYFQIGKPGRAAFFLNPSNPDLPAQYADIPRSVDLPLFTGIYYSYMNEERREVYKYLCKRKDVQLIGCPRRYIRSSTLRRLYVKLNPIVYLRGKEYIEKIIRSRFGIAVSGFQNIKYYTSDRLSHYLTFGKLVLAYRFPGCEDLFENDREVVFYEGIDDLDRKIDHYLNNPDEAEEIGLRGQKKMNSDYSAAQMVIMMMEIIEKGSSDLYPWVEVYS